MIQNKLHYLLLSLLAACMLLAACQDDPEFPDPGFEVKDKTIELRRDTIDTYVLEFNMEVPNGVNLIEVINGNDYTVIEQVDAYNGQTSFVFSYHIDLTPFEQDTLLNYIVRVKDNNDRSISKGLTLDVKKKSTPEVLFVGGDRISVAAPAVLAKARISTGMAPIESISIHFDNEEMLVIDSIFTDSLIYSYDLKEQIILGTLEEGQEYKFEIVVNDKGYNYTTSAGKNVSSDPKTYTKEVAVTKGDRGRVIPSQIIYATGGTNYTRYYIYSEDGLRLDSLIIQSWSRFNHVWFDPWGQIEFKYNELDMLDTIKFDNRGTKSEVVLSYLEGTTQLDKIETVTNDGATTTVIIRDISYNNLGHPISYYYQASDYLVKDLRYIDPFEIGEYVGIEVIGRNLGIAPGAADRDYYDSFAPVFSPLYTTGIPSITHFPSSAFAGIYNLLGASPYMPTEIWEAKNDQTGEIDPDTQKSEDLVTEYEYATNDDGKLTQIRWITVDGWGRETENIYNLIYE